MNVNWTVSLIVIAGGLLRFTRVAILIREQLGEAQSLVLGVTDDHRCGGGLFLCERGGTGGEELLVKDGSGVVEVGDF
jgi:hypothetical protein